MLLLDRIGLEEEEEDVEFCAYAIMGAAFKTTMVNSSPAIATLLILNSRRILKMIVFHVHP